MQKIKDNETTLFNAQRVFNLHKYAGIFNPDNIAAERRTYAYKEWSRKMTILEEKLVAVAFSPKECYDILLTHVGGRALFLVENSKPDDSSYVTGRLILENEYFSKSKFLTGVFLELLTLPPMKETADSMQTTKISFMSLWKQWLFDQPGKEQILDFIFLTIFIFLQIEQRGERRN